MASDSQINTAAAGLLQLLDIKSGGITPGELNNTLQPTFDLARGYIAQDIVLETKTDSGLAAAANTEINVPVGERWFIQLVGGKIDRTAGSGDITCLLRAQIQEQGFAPLITSQKFTMGATNQERNISTGYLTYPLILIGGAQLQLRSVDPGFTFNQTLFVVARKIPA